MNCMGLVLRPRKKIRHRHPKTPSTIGAWRLQLDPVWAYLQTSAARQYFLKAAKKTSNLASINMTQLRNLPLPLPRLETQQKFQERFRACRALEKQQSDATGIADVSFQSLLAGVFSERQVT